MTDPAKIAATLTEQAKPEPAREFRVGDRVRHVSRDDWGVREVLEIDCLSGAVRSVWPFSAMTWNWPSDLIHAPDPAAETFFAPDYVTPVGEPDPPAYAFEGTYILN